ncbi:MAG: putative GNAT family acetyltransferase [Pseudohongiellaceae bacterium]|jgi:predicted GNAT family acetyltransferase
MCMKKQGPLVEHQIVVNHDQAANEFFVDLKCLNLEPLSLDLLASGDEKAVLKYRIDAVSCVDFYNTFVPKLARGRGVAEALVDAALAWATKNDLKQRASCWYVQKYLKSEL